MKLKLLIVITVLAVVGIVVIAVVKKSNSVPEKPEITEVTTDVQVERELETDLDSLGGKDEEQIRENVQINYCYLSKKCRDSIRVVKAKNKQGNSPENNNDKYYLLDDELHRNFIDSVLDEVAKLPTIKKP